IQVGDKAIDQDGYFFINSYLVHNKTNKPKKHYHAQFFNETRGVPFANTFVTQMQLCISKINKNNCQLKVSWEINFIENVFYLTRKTITRQVIDISKDMMTEYGFFFSFKYSKFVKRKPLCEKKIFFIKFK
ncbi:hypothetical protein HZS_6871, partial [Henneguya salminicola]